MKFRTGLICLLLFLLADVALFGQITAATSIGIIPTENLTGNRRMDAEAGNLTLLLNTLLLQINKGSVNLALMPSGFISDEKALRALAEQNGYDLIITGSIRMDSTGKTILLELKVYSRAAGVFTETKTSEIKKTADFTRLSEEAALSLLSGISGSSVKTKTLLLGNTGSSGHYNIYLDNRLIGQDYTELKVIGGTKALRITQILETSLLNMNLDADGKGETIAAIELRDLTAEPVTDKTKIIRLPERDEKAWKALTEQKTPDFTMKIPLDGKKHESVELRPGTYLIRISGFSTGKENSWDEADALAKWSTAQANSTQLVTTLFIEGMVIDWGGKYKTDHVYYEVVRILEPAGIAFIKNGELAVFTRPLTADFYYLEP